MSDESDALAVPVDVTMRRPTLCRVPVTPILAAPLVVRRAQIVGFFDRKLPSGSPRR
jgi:hypothetical protein